ncbi:putative amidophosphoribosyltransferase [Aequorivita sublithincola DSM 14238]|uniref:Putative amidophosphoribosyltransferase n=1 Tax=Aequorivita sublithincola (strain DSM 14238 / LMG 21431 / ACAM 643 / 9-3) TaxID=746697 RepID=I3YV59_AEQSU|nr:phosphoribosyltransferase family protein [Aequorivita sublithincola]AFL80877.1 putative amidophosphoribosyltransferase [Aequorivita sublithincola DSM 14238]
MLNLLFPKVCVGCKELLLKGEETLCMDCIHSLPVASFHKTDSEMLKDKFYGRFLVKNATALVYFQKRGLTQELLHNLKYRGKNEVSYFFGKWLGAELAENSAYNEIEMVIPVPLHKQKLKKRGYNQVEGFGKEIALALNVPYRDDVLIKISKSGSQVFKTRILRFEAEEEFTVQNIEAIKDKHILLVDDIITTGATLEKCGLQLLKGENVSISIATIATT